MASRNDPADPIGRKIVGTVSLMKKKNALDITALGASVLDRVHELLGQKVSFRLVSTTSSNSETLPCGEGRGKVGSPAYLEEWIDTLTPVLAAETAFRVTFDFDHDFGLPGAVIVRNDHHSEFYLGNVTLEDVPGHGRVHFVCHSWVYPAKYYERDRVFFSNKVYLPDQTPPPLVKTREEELMTLRGDGKGELREWDRVYDYAYYNDLGNPDKGLKYARPVLGGSAEFPYPRRGRTGRPPSKSDPNTESRIPLLESLKIYVPRDERFGHIKLADFLAFGGKSIGQFLNSELEALLEGSPKEFNSFRDIIHLYEGGIKLSESLSESIQRDVPLEVVKEILPTEGEGILKYPLPQVIEHDKSAWMTDEEFAREMLAGVNPVIISRLQEFPPKSKLDPAIYGNQASSITEDHIKNRLDGLSVHEALDKNKLFILDHHDSVMPYLRRINAMTTKTYATRTLLFLRDGTLRPLAIELSLPHPDGDQFGAVSEVYTPADQGIESSVWQLAKAYAAVNDSGHHQLISHWLNTHAVIEPFVIATNRQLSVLHPIYKLLQPHFRDTMNINAFGRQVVINAGGILESTVYPSKYSMELSSAIYKGWIFPEQGLPADLIKRGVAVEDKNSPHGLRLLIEDYPYAVDGLEIWSAIRTWVEDYCSYYYKSDDIVKIKNDKELHSWWKELVEKGHGDKKDEPWWPEMKTLKDLTETCTTIIWVASALHAALNFGQFPYAGYMPNRPTVSRRFMPKEGTPEYEELRSDPEKAYLRTITAQLPTLLGISLIEILSRHSNDEVYLGQRDTPEWTADIEPLRAFDKFRKKLEEIERKILQMNGDERWKNRVGPVNVPYTLLYPTSESGMTGKGIPNSVSI